MTQIVTSARVVLFIGQSNPKGRVPIANLPLALSGNIGNIFLWDGSGWRNLKAKDMSGYPEVGLDWGPEMQLGVLMAGRYKNPVFFVKYALSGTPLVTATAPTWNPNTAGSLYANAVSTLTTALASLTTRGYNPYLQGVVWGQGENDAQAGVTQASYKAVEAQLFADLRSAFSRPYLPILNVGILPQVSGAGAINAAKAAQILPNVRFQSAAAFGNVGDNLHFDAAAQVAVGQAAFEFFS